MNSISNVLCNLLGKDGKWWLQYYMMKHSIESENFNEEKYIKIYFRLAMGKFPNLEHPQTFSEKLQWLKLYDRRPEYTMMVDKYAVKEYVSHVIGQEYVIPVLGVWNRPEDIDYDSLPNQFVLKCNHDSGGLVICKDKSKFDKEKAYKKIKKSFKRNLFFGTREWPYKNVKPLVFAEEYKEDKYGELRDYKFFCFDGKVKAMFIATDRQKQGEDTKFDFFDENFNHLPFTNGHPNANPMPAKPSCFEKMKELAEKLSAGIPHVRVDFYEVDESVYFGELTFFHWGGIKPFEPEEWDYKFGSWIKLPNKK